MKSTKMILLLLRLVPGPGHIKMNMARLILSLLWEPFIPGDTDVFKTSSGRLKKVTTSYDQTRRHHDVWKMTSDLRRLEDV